MRIYEQRERLEGNVIVLAAGAVLFAEWFLWPIIAESATDDERTLSARVALRVIIVLGLGLLYWRLLWFRETSGQRAFSHCFVLIVAVANGIAPIAIRLKPLEAMYRDPAVSWRGALGQEWETLCQGNAPLVLSSLVGMTVAVAVLAFLVWADLRVWRKLSRLQELPENDSGDARRAPDAAYRQVYYWWSLNSWDVAGEHYTSFLVEFDPRVWTDFLRLLLKNGHYDYVLVHLRNGARWHRNSQLSLEAVALAAEAARRLGGDAEVQRLARFITRTYRGSLIAGAAERVLECGESR